MAKFKFGNIVKEVKINVDRANNPYEFYVAGDHMDTEDLVIRRRGKFATDDVGPAFTRIFNPGQILYGSRRTYLKKVAVADFEGICANTTFVLETKDSNVLLQELLPYIMLSDSFTEWSVSHSKGSTNPYVLFSDLAEFEVELPSIAEQRVLSNKLLAAQRVKESYRRLLIDTDELVKSQFIEMFGGDQYKQVELDALAQDWQKGQAFKKDNLMAEGKHKCIHYGELFTKYGPIIDGVLSSTDDDIIKGSKSGDILFPASDVTPDGLARCSVLMLDDVLLGGDIIVLRPHTGIIPEYLSWAINMQKDQLLKRVTGSVVRHMSAKGLKTVTVPIPSKEKQQQFISIVRQADKSKFELKKSIKKIENVITSIIQQGIER